MIRSFRATESPPVFGLRSSVLAEPETEDGRPKTPGASPESRFLAAYHIVQPIQRASAAANIVHRSGAEDIGGSCASFIAMPAWNGFVGPNALPIAAAPVLIATTDTASTPRPRPRRSSAGTSG